MLSGKNMGNRMSVKNLGWRSKKCNKSVLSFKFKFNSIILSYLEVTKSGTTKN